MARLYLRVEASLPRHPKVRRLAELLALPEAIGTDLVIGFLLRWWGYCAEFGSSGKPAEVPRSILHDFAKSMLGASSLVVTPDLVDSLREARLMDTHGRPWDWQDYTGLLLKQRANDAERKRKGQGGSAASPAISVQGSTAQLKEGALARKDKLPEPDISPRKLRLPEPPALAEGDDPFPDFGAKAGEVAS